MQTPSVPKRRAITSCSNCYRRKQKCNRRRPCNNCNARKVGHECYYDSLFRHSAEANPEVARVTNETRTSGKLGEMSPHNSPTVRDRLGYSSTKESNAFVEARKTPLTSDHESHMQSLESVAPIWRRYWMAISGLPSVTAVDELVAIYLSEINWLYGIVEPFYFRRAFKEWRTYTSSASSSSGIESISISLRSFPGLLFQVLAITLLFLPPGARIEELPEVDYVQLSQKYTDIGLDLIHLLGHQGTTLITVQHDLLRAAWLKNRGHGGEAWHALSDSIRKAQELNLHRRSKTVQRSTGEEFWYYEWKKRLWITLYAWDSNMSILLGRPRLVNAIDCDADLPINCDFPESLESMGLSTTHAYSSHDNRVPSSVCLSLLMYELSQKIHEIRTLGADKPGLQDYTIIQRFHSEILSLVKELPSTIRTPDPDISLDLQFPIIPRLREKIFTTAYSLLMALHRPHVAKHMESRETVLKAGLAVLESQQRFFEAITQLHYAYFGNAFFSIDAVIVLSTVVSSFPSENVGLLQQIVLATQQAIGRLCLIEAENEMARAGIKIVRSCHQTVKDAYERSKLVNPVSTSSSITHEYHGPEDETFQPGDKLTFPELGDSLDTGFSIYHNAVANEAGFNESMIPMDQTGATEFDISYWMGYRQQVVNDAVDMFD